MYNSVLVRLLHKLGTGFSKLYKTSFIHKVFHTLGKKISICYRNSYLSVFSKNLRRVFEASFIYKLSVGVLKGFDRALGALFDGKKKLTSGSEIANNLDLYTLDLRYGLRLFYESLVFLGIIFIPGKLIFGLPSFKVIGILLVLGLFGISISGKEFQMVKTSKFLSFFGDIFKLDKGGESWW